MALLINIIAAVVLFLIPILAYSKGEDKIVPDPFDKERNISISFELYFLIYSVLTAMVFLGPLSLVKYAFWIIFLIFLASKRLELKFGGIVNSYILFLVWGVVSAVFMSSAKYSSMMMLIKYSLPLFYLWLGYTAINDSDDLLYFLKKVAIGMCIYALIIGGFSEKFLGPLYAFLNFTSGGLFISYASLADYFSGLIVIPIGLYIITSEKKWLWATVWVILSTILEAVRTGLGGIFLASSFFLLTIYKWKAAPWIAGLCILAVSAVFTIPTLREKMFKDENVSISTFSVSDTNFENINSNAREFLWELNMQKFYYPSPTVGSGLGSVTDFMKNTSATVLEQIHSDYVQILCDLGLIGITLFGLFFVFTFLEIISNAWKDDSPFALKLTGGMALGSCAGTFFSMAFDNVVAYAQQSFVIPFIMIGIYLKVKDLYHTGQWKE